MNKKQVLIGSFLLLLLFPLGYSHAAIFTENFNSASGGSLISTESYSERWSSTNYYNGVSATGWSFYGQAILAENGADTAEKAILLNESPRASMATSPSISVVSGASYILTFDHWGDNRPGPTGYHFIVFIDGIPLSYISRTYSLTDSWVTETLSFTALDSNLTLSFTDISSGQASPIIDNISISIVPVPPTVWLLGSGLVGIIGLRRRFWR
jgi:hypothetical protein